MARKKAGSVKLTDDVLVTSVDLSSADVTSVLPTARGGTGTGAPSAGDLLYGTSGPAWARLAAGADGKVLALVSGLPAWVTNDAVTAQTLATPRNINGVAFDGSANITVTAAAGTLTGSSLAATVTGSSLTSVGTLATLSVTGEVTAGLGFSISAAAGNFRSWIVRSSGSLRWRFGADDTSEAGSNAGTDWFWNAYGDGGAFIDAILTVKRKADSPIVLGRPLGLSGYTVSGLPTPVGSRPIAFVTDLTTPTFMGTAVGGGSVVGVVFYNGSTWITI